MSRKLTIYILLIAAISAMGQDGGHNYIVQRVMLDTLGVNTAETVTYYDGLGRREEVVQRGVTPNGRDLVSYITRDNAGRERHVYLPSVSTGAGMYTPKSQVDQLAVTTYADGTQVYVNYSTRDYRAGSVKVPARDYLVKRGGGQ